MGGRGLSALTSMASVSMLWIGRPLRWVEKLSIASFVNSGHRVQVFTQGPQPALPSEVVRRDVDEVVSSRSIFANPQEPGTFAMFSNLFRYRLLPG